MGNASWERGQWCALMWGEDRVWRGVAESEGGCGEESVSGDMYENSGDRVGEGVGGSEVAVEKNSGERGGGDRSSGSEVMVRVNWGVWEWGKEVWEGIRDISLSG